MNKQHKRIIGLVFLLWGTIHVQAQQESEYTNYMYNTGVLNPAYTGSRGTLGINVLQRNQWIGFDGAPVNNSFAADIAVGEDLGFGLTAVFDKIGATVRNTYGVNGAYHLKLTRDVKISLGLRVGAEYYTVDYTQLDPYDETDMLYANNVRSFNPLVGVGVFLYSDKMYFGFSSPQIFSGYYDGRFSNHGRSVSHYYLMAGYVAELSSDLKMKPSILMKWTGNDFGNPFAVDVYGLNASLNFLMFNKLTLGAAYSYKSSCSGLVAFAIRPELLFGYSYDFNVNQLRNYSGGTHEIFLKYELPVGRKSKYQVVNPRFF